MKRKLSVSAALSLVLVAVLLTFLITNSAVSNDFNRKLSEIEGDKIEYQKLSTVDAIIREHFALAMDDVKQSEGSIRGYVAGLGDPYSRYMDAEEYAVYLQENTVFSSNTLGIELAQNSQTGSVFISYVESASDAANFGLKRGMQVEKIGELAAPGAELDKLQALLSGTANETIGISVLSGEESVTYTLTYKQQPKDRIFSTLVHGQAGYIQIRVFDEETKNELKTAIDNAIASGADALLFDVRGVSSLNFAKAVECVDVIAGIGDLARVMSKGGTVETLQGDGASVPVDCAVLLDENTSGAPELFAACLRDCVSAKLVGAKSVGCASVQADIKLNDMSAILLTTKIYLPPASDGFEGVGVNPDLSLKNTVDFGVLEFEDDEVLSEAYFVLKPDKRPGDEGNVVVPQPDENAGEGPTLIQPGL